MDIKALKETAFHHGEKIALAVVVLFVGVSAYRHFASSDEAKPFRRDPIAVPAARQETDAIDAHFVRAAEPFVRSIGVVTTTRNRFWPAGVTGYPFYRDQILQMKTKKETVLAPLFESTATITLKRLGGMVVVEGRKIEPADPPATAKLTHISLDEEGSQQLIDRHKHQDLPVATQDAKVEATIAVPKEGDPTLTFEAVEPGNWVRFDVKLDDESIHRFHVMVVEAGVQIEKRLPIPVITSVEENPTSVAVVSFRLEKIEKGTGETGTQYKPLVPTHFNLYRLAGDEEGEPRLIATKTEAEATESRMRREPRRGPRERPDLPPDYPGGYAPDEPPPRPRPRPAPRDVGVPPEALERDEDARRRFMAPRREAEESPIFDKTYSISDDTVEYETSYTYWVESVVKSKDPDIPDRKRRDKSSEELLGHVFTTKQQFAYKYIGNTRGGAKIRVYINIVEAPDAKRDKAKAAARREPKEPVFKDFVVQIGGRVGDLPGSRGARPARAKGEADRTNPRGKDPADAYRFVTRVVLVDKRRTHKQAEQPITRWIREPGRAPRLERGTALKDSLAYQVVLCDRKNRLVGLWLEPAPRKRRTARTRTPKRRKPTPPRYPPSEIPPEYREE